MRKNREREHNNDKYAMSVSSWWFKSVRVFVFSVMFGRQMFTLFNFERDLTFLMVKRKMESK